MNELDRLIGLRVRAVEELRALVDAADKRPEETRAFTGEESQTYDRLNADIDGLDQRITQRRALEQRFVAEDDVTREVRAGADRETRSPSQLANDQLRALLRGDVRGVDFAASAGVDGHQLRSLAHAELTGTERRDLVEGTATAGGNTVPTTFLNRFYEAMTVNSSILQMGVTVLNTSSGETLTIPKSNALSSAALIAEAASITESDPTFAQASLSAYKYGLAMQVSSELAQDTAINLVDFLGRQGGRAVSEAFGLHLTTGTGSSQPQGVTVGATVGVTGATSVAGVFTADNLIDLMYSVTAPYRNSPSAAFLMRDATVATLRKIKDSTGQYLWQPSLQLGAPDVFLGKPVYTDPNIAATAINAKSVFFGDWSAYYVRLVGGVRFESSVDFAFANDLITYRILMRGDGRLMDTSAIKYFVGGAS